MRLSPRDRCYAALAAYDQVATAMTHPGARRNTPAVDRAGRELANAMDALYGPLPSESEIVFAARSRGQRPTI